MEQARTNYIPTLDGWRAIAILLVIVSHSMRSDDPDWLWCGFFGVDIFFGISGFLITLLLLCEHESNGAISLRGFYIRRAFRILPPLFILLIVVGVAGLYRSRLEIAADLLLYVRVVAQKDLEEVAAADDANQA